MRKYVNDFEGFLNEKTKVAKIFNDDGALGYEEDNRILHKIVKITSRKFKDALTDIGHYNDFSATNVYDGFKGILSDIDDVGGDIYVGREGSPVIYIGFTTVPEDDYESYQKVVNIANHLKAAKSTMLNDEFNLYNEETGSLKNVKALQKISIKMKKDGMSASSKFRQQYDKNLIKHGQDLLKKMDKYTQIIRLWWD